MTGNSILMDNLPESDPALEQVNGGFTLKSLPQQQQQQQPNNNQEHPESSGAFPFRSSSPNRATVRFGGVTQVLEFDQPRHHDDDNDGDNAVEDSSTTTTTTSLWYSSQDYEQFKVLAMVEAKKASKQYSGSKRLIRQAYQQALVVAAATEPLPPPPSNDDDHQNYLGVAGHGCVDALGLEQLSDRGIYRHRKRRRVCLLETVSHIQQTVVAAPQQQQQQQHYDTTAQLLRRACQGISRPSKLFAHYLATSMATLPDHADNDNDNDINSATKQQVHIFSFGTQPSSAWR
ncbi:hypothetical protein ACA910_009767 [Epithemia clementina (nom. ined.)]